MKHVMSKLLRSSVKVGLAISAISMMVTDANAADIKDVAREDTFVIAGPSSGRPTFPTPGIANPFIIGAEIRTGIISMFEPLFYYNAYQDKHIPWLAESYKYSDGYKQIDLVLRKGVTWSDGQAFDSEDVVFTINMLINNGKTTKDMQYATQFSGRVASIEATGSHGVVIKLKKTDPRFVYNYLSNYFGNGLFLQPEHIWKDVKDPGSFKNYDPEKGLPVTTSPWNVVLSSPQQTFMDRNDNWWASKTGFHPLPEIKRIIGVPFVNTDRGAQLMVSNAVDMTMGYPNAALVEKILEQNPKATTFSGREKPYGNLDWWPTSLYFNFKSEKVQDIRLRRAISHAVNREQAVEVGYSGASEVSNSPFPAFEPLKPYIAIADKLSKKHGVGTFNLKESDRLMTEMGYAKNGKKMWEKDGKTLKMNIEGIAPMRSVGPVVMQQLRNAGFDIKFISNSNTRKRTLSGQADLILFGHLGSIDDPYRTLDNYHCKNALDVGKTSFQIARWCNEDYSKIVDQISLLPRGDKQVDVLVEKALDLWFKNVVELPINQWYHRIPVNLTRWTNYPSKDNPYLQPAFWYKSGQAGYMFNKLKKQK